MVARALPAMPHGHHGHAKHLHVNEFGARLIFLRWSRERCRVDGPAGDERWE